ncbi:MAG: hypothetical protein UR85_C0008G0035 [Candidatus Nomurabacteria bacterium GW2011_GWF2_35_66]|uniref:PQ loop repeat protein n=1 Tax=Candidatus Nomurabacteria bacterium GW2011_GWE1_35_16 TaxID=1618761 RepID=A0A0G0BA96_9BACT|nr:MAG: hypothetical protein UR55_C0011G0034 [Candidatus Nomurabacteria bacterium GW2011_GWF1_34_20]KKP62870.1 MAG: hypothetical protein UR57_C0010G0034 [Candidatus Nomurabacteria bacterium GW2011_GWE2_34_25]KKP66269.1 MAG: hypothetical protein UR64_C0010G0034 [Candidatus Nomurabacteria bacterium GW2011_GWE1_35_16]KKP83102.1 MAG: hypothetical protein UR85_C0008G0035 [Candidatus Nomurabacteria bacterium GW2011_GWF2_35_66]HAE36696.1 hypothetical protein [Candidatus Nomurabacteria bacterium]
MDQILSIIAALLSLSVSIIGLPLQIHTNYKLKKVIGLRPELFLISFLSYAVWSLRAYFINDWYMFVAYLPGAIFSFVILVQIKLYKKP